MSPGFTSSEKPSYGLSFDAAMSVIGRFVIDHASGAGTTGGPGTDADLVVVGPDAVAATTARAGRVTVACSLDPWGRGLDDLPDGVLDFSRLERNRRKYE